MIATLYLAPLIFLQKTVILFVVHHVHVCHIQWFLDHKVEAINLNKIKLKYIKRFLLYDTHTVSNGHNSCCHHSTGLIQVIREYGPSYQNMFPVKAFQFRETLESDNYIRSLISYQGLACERGRISGCQ